VGNTFSTNAYRMHQNMIYKEPELDSDMSPEAKSLLRGLLTKDPSRRLGSQIQTRNIENHPFFAKHGIDWEKLERRQMIPEMRPRLRHPGDVSNFEQTYTLQAPGLSPESSVVSMSHSVSHSQSCYSPSNNTLLSPSVSIVSVSISQAAGNSYAGNSYVGGSAAHSYQVGPGRFSPLQNDRIAGSLDENDRLTSEKIHGQSTAVGENHSLDPIHSEGTASISPPTNLYYHSESSNFHDM